MDDAEAVAPVEAHVAQLSIELAAARSEIAQLMEALSTSRRIGAAIGIVMARLTVTEETAFEVLRLASQNSNRKLRDVADDVVHTGATP